MTGTAHRHEQMIDRQPLTRRTAPGQRRADRLAARARRTQHVHHTLPFDRLDPGQLIRHPMPQPPPPQIPHRLQTRPHLAAPYGQLQTSRRQLGESARLEQQRPGEGPHCLALVEITASEDLADRTHRGRRRALRLIAAPQPARRGQLQHRREVGLRPLLHHPLGLRHRVCHTGSSYGRPASVRTVPVTLTVRSPVSTRRPWQQGPPGERVPTALNPSHAAEPLAWIIRG